MANAADADTFIHAVVRDGRTAELSAADRALCEHAVKLTAHQRRMTPADLDILRGHGFDGVAIHDTTQVIGYFNYIARIADGLGVPPEEFIDPPWGYDGGHSSRSPMTCGRVDYACSASRKEPWQTDAG